MAGTADLLAEAEDALHKLLTGTSATIVTYADGRSVTYTRATVPELQAYIARLRGGRISTVRLSSSKGF